MGLRERIERTKLMKLTKTEWSTTRVTPEFKLRIEACALVTGCKPAGFIFAALQEAVEQIEHEQEGRCVFAALQEAVEQIEHEQEGR